MHRQRIDTLHNQPDWMTAGIASFSFLSSTSDGERPEQMKILPIGEHGFTLRDFTLGPELGRGEGGGVRIAAHRPSKIRYALKEISIGAQATRHQLGKELQMQRNCRFPHIVQLYDVFYDEGRVYLVLELMDWGSLERLLQAQQQQQDPSRKGMDEGVLGVVMHRIMCAVSYLQTEHKIIHRDLKPGNVVMSCNGNVKLSDFGVRLLTLAPSLIVPSLLSCSTTRNTVGGPSTLRLPYSSAPPRPLTTFSASGAAPSPRLAGEPRARQRRQGAELGRDGLLHEPRAAPGGGVLA